LHPRFVLSRLRTFRLSAVRGILKKHTSVLAGITDSGLASLATFLIGLYAIRLLDPVTLGAYALCYRAMFLVGNIPSQLIFVPAQIRIVERDTKERLDYLLRSVVLGLLPSLGAALIVVGWFLVAPPDVPSHVIIGLTITAIGTAFLSPIQDHVRRVLHTADMSSWAAVTSAAQLSGAIIALIVLSSLPIDRVWIPFGALGLANLFSTLIGILPALSRDRSQKGSGLLRFTDLASSGRWLVLNGMIPSGTNFTVASIVAGLAGSAALGYAEAARIIASTVTVLSQGINAVLGPRSVRDAQQLARTRANRRARRFAGLLAAGTIGLILLLGWGWFLNPLATLVPLAYHVPGLVSLSLLAAGMTASALLRRYDLLGARKEALLPAIELIVALGGLLVSLTAAITRAYSIPLSLLTMGIIRWIAFSRATSQYYKASANTPQHT